MLGLCWGLTASPLSGLGMFWDGREGSPETCVLPLGVSLSALSIPAYQDPLFSVWGL